jgi:hypothetical protein
MAIADRRGLLLVAPLLTANVREMIMHSLSH